MASLSPRELELAQLVAAGYTNAEIASTLQISRQTVKNHLQAAYTKLGVHNRVLLSYKVRDLKSKESSKSKFVK